MIFQSNANWDSILQNYPLGNIYSRLLRIDAFIISFYITWESLESNRIYLKGYDFELIDLTSRKYSMTYPKGASAAQARLHGQTFSQFHAVFRTSGKIMRWLPRLEGSRLLLRKILDPPLILKSMEGHVQRERKFLHCATRFNGYRFRSNSI